MAATRFLLVVNVIALFDPLKLIFPSRYVFIRRSRMAAYTIRIESEILANVQGILLFAVLIINFGAPH